MSLPEVLGLLEGLASLLRREVLDFVGKERQGGFLLNEVRVFLDCVDDGMDHGDGAACILGVLLHVEQVFGELLAWGI